MDTFAREEDAARKGKDSDASAGVDEVTKMTATE